MDEDEKARLEWRETLAIMRDTFGRLTAYAEAHGASTDTPLGHCRAGLGRMIDSVDAGLAADEAKLGKGKDDAVDPNA